MAVSSGNAAKKCRSDTSPFLLYGADSDITSINYQISQCVNVIFLSHYYCCVKNVDFVRELSAIYFQNHEAWAAARQIQDEADEDQEHDKGHHNSKC